MLFSDEYGIEEFWEKEWFNPVFETDVNLFIDPYLVENSDIPEFKGAREKINKFFSHIIERIAFYRSMKDENSEVLLRNMLMFPEVDGLRLGYSRGSRGGSGTGKSFANTLYNTICELIDNIEVDQENFSHIEILTFFSTGIGPDRISDITANILKEELIAYTQRICRENGAEMEKFPVRHYKFDFDEDRWRDGHFELPKNTYNDESIFLVPKEFLRRSPLLSSLEFKKYLLQHDTEYLRSSLNIRFSKDISRKKLLEIVKNNPKRLYKFVDSFYGEGKVRKAYYDYAKDSKKVYYKEFLPSLIKESLPSIQLKTKYTDIELFDFIKKLVEDFRHFVEKGEGYKLLRNPSDKKPFDESYIQLIFYSTIKLVCEEHNIEISEESKAANGRIEFKFSQGVKSRTYLEIKLAKHDKLLDGYQKQLPAYMEGKKVTHGIFLVLFFEDKEQKAIEKLREVKLDSKYSGLAISIESIDARVRPTPSNL